MVFLFSVTNPALLSSEPLTPPRDLLISIASVPNNKNPTGRLVFCLVSLIHIHFLSLVVPRISLKMPTPGGKPHPQKGPSSSYTPSDYSYFSPHAPFTTPASAPNLTSNSLHPSSSPTTPGNGTGHTYTTHTTTPQGPVITSTITTRGSGGIRHTHPYPGGGGAGGHGGNSNALQQFALHIPPPPPLALSTSAVRNPSAFYSGSSPSPSSSVSPAFPPSHIHSYPIPSHNHPLAAPQMTLTSTSAKYTLSVLLPNNIQPEMVTISANKGDRLRVVADAFGGDECEYSFYLRIDFFPAVGFRPLSTF